MLSLLFIYNFSIAIKYHLAGQSRKSINVVNWAKNPIVSPLSPHLSLRSLTLFELQTRTRTFAFRKRDSSRARMNCPTELN